jgi:hypothetical protein
MEFKIKICNSFKDRFMGFMFQKEKKEVGYLFKNCNSIHTFFCFFNLDIVLLDKNNKIISIKKGVKPWRIFFFKCSSILEIPSELLPNNLEKYLDNL